MSSIKVFTDQTQNNLIHRISIAGRYAGVKVDVQQDASAVSRSPVHKLPIAETKEGILFEHNAIARFVARHGKNHLFGSSPFEEAQIEQWIDFSTHEIELPAAVWVFPIQGRIPNNAAAVQRAQSDLRKVLDVLNHHLLTRTFLVGHRVTFADIVVSMSLFHLYELVFDASFRKPFQNVNRWYMTCVNQPEFKGVLGEVHFCESAKQAPTEFHPSTSSNVAAAAPKTQDAPQQNKKKEEKPKKEKEEKPKEEKPKKEKEEKPPKEEEEEDYGDEGEGHQEKEKKKNVLDLLPPSKFAMDDWKRFYSNNDTDKSIPWFWEHFDPEGYCLWFADYKYNSELEVDFKCLNLMNGFMQRLEKGRKYCFGSLILFNSSAPFALACCWLFRGTEIPAEMKECEDAELYNWRKVDINDPSQKQLVNDFWCWEGKFGTGRQFNQGKIFK